MHHTTNEMCSQRSASALTRHHAVGLQVIWPGLFGRYGAPLPYEFDISTLAHISEGYASGDIELVVRSLLTEHRLAQLKERPVDIPEIIQWLCRVGVWCWCLQVL